MKITVRPIVFKDKMTEKKLEKYANDPNVFVIYNVYHYIHMTYERNGKKGCPSQDECFKTRPLKTMYDQAKNLSVICAAINSGTYILCRLIATA